MNRQALVLLSSPSFSQCPNVCILCMCVCGCNQSYHVGVRLCSRLPIPTRATSLILKHFIYELSVAGVSFCQQTTENTTTAERLTKHLVNLAIAMQEHDQHFRKTGLREF